MNLLEYVANWRVLLAYALGLLIIYIVARLVSAPVKQMLRLGLNITAGILLLLLFNLVGRYFGLHVPLNPVTALVAGLLGVPGIGLMVALQSLLDNVS